MKRTSKILSLALTLGLAPRLASAVCPDPKMDELISRIRTRLDVVDAEKEKQTLALEELRDPESGTSSEDYSDELGRPWDKLALYEKVLYTKPTPASGSCTKNPIFAVRST